MDALSALLTAEPVLTRVLTAAQAVGLPHRMLLHAGPPLGDPRHPPAPIRSAAVLTARHEGWASDEVEAERMIEREEIQFAPAQDWHCVTPLAALISPKTPLFEVSDAQGNRSARAFSPVSTVRGPDTRMGHRDPAILARMTERDHTLAPALSALLEADGPIPLWPLARAGLAAGDDLHSRTHGANAALVEQLRPRLADDLLEAIAATPLFFLTLWMAACAALLRSAERGDRPTLITRGGGNGERFGLSLAAAPRAWISVPAQAPQGWRLPSAPGAAEVFGAVGDSAVIDLLGLGAQRFAFAPEPLGVLGPWLPADHAAIATRLGGRIDARIEPPTPLGLDAGQIAHSAVSPLIALAMIGADGRSGLLGRGVYRPPAALFSQAVDALD